MEKSKIKLPHVPDWGRLCLMCTVLSGTSLWCVLWICFGRVYLTFLTFVLVFIVLSCISATYFCWFCHTDIIIYVYIFNPKYVYFLFIYYILSVYNQIGNKLQNKTQIRVGSIKYMETERWILKYLHRMYQYMNA